MASLCTVSFSVKIGTTAVEGAVCRARLLGTNHVSDDALLSNAELSDTTDASGDASLALVQKGSIEKGSGVYEISVEINGNPVASIQTAMPNQSTVQFEDLLGA